MITTNEDSSAAGAIRVPHLAAFAALSAPATPVSAFDPAQGLTVDITSRLGVPADEEAPLAA